MNALLRTPVGRFRVVSLLEGASFLLLVFVAMPLKYMAGMPFAVRVVGMIHGLLFVAYVAALWAASDAPGWTLRRSALFFVASLVPFGALWVEKTLRDDERGVTSPR